MGQACHLGTDLDQLPTFPATLTLTATITPRGSGFRTQLLNASGGPRGLRHDHFGIKTPGIPCQGPAATSVLSRTPPRTLPQIGDVAGALITAGPNRSMTTGAWFQTH